MEGKKEGKKKGRKGRRRGGEEGMVEGKEEGGKGEMSKMALHGQCRLLPPSDDFFLI